MLCATSFGLLALGCSLKSSAEATPNLIVPSPYASVRDPERSELASLATRYFRSLSDPSQAVVLRGQDRGRLYTGIRKGAAYRYSAASGSLRLQWSSDGTTYRHTQYNSFEGVAGKRRAASLATVESIVDGSLFSRPATLLQINRHGNGAVFQYTYKGNNVRVVFDMKTGLPRTASFLSAGSLQSVEHIKVIATSFGNVVSAWCFQATCFRFQTVARQTSDTLQAISPATQRYADAPAQILPFTEKDGLIFIPVFIGGKRMHFVFDTGAALMVVSSKLRAKADILFDGIFQAMTAGGAQDTQLGRVRDVTIKGIYLHNEVAAVLPIPYDGLIGLSSFRNYSVEIDYQNRRVILTSRHLTTGTPVDTYDGVPEIDGRWDTARGSFLVDTGAPVNVVIPQSLSDFGPAKAALPRCRPAVNALPSFSYQGTVKTFEAAGISGGLTDVCFAFTALQFGRDKIGVIGNQWLKQFHLTMDLNGGVFSLKR